jgi:sugar/nucleoside kinase (ribokinase family)
VDYLVIGHLTQDITPAGPVLGGTAAYAALTAAALGLRVGILTAYPADRPLPELATIQVAAQPGPQPTTFQNLATPAGRVQFLHHMADVLQVDMLPETWLSTPIVHFGPVAHEIPEDMLDLFADSFIGITPQGWMRRWDAQGAVTTGKWPKAAEVLTKASAVVLSLEDVAGDEETVARFSEWAPMLVVTEGAHGARLYQGHQMQRISAPKTPETDATGAGDIFAAAFFVHLYRTGSMEAAARFATLLAANSVTRSGLKGIPQPAEVHQHLAETIEKT